MIDIDAIRKRTEEAVRKCFEKSEELAGLVHLGVSDSMELRREGYEQKIADTVRSLSYFKRVEAAAPSIILGFSLESDQDWTAHKYLTDSVDLLFGVK